MSTSIKSAGLRTIQPMTIRSTITEQYTHFAQQNANISHSEYLYIWKSMNLGMTLNENCYSNKNLLFLTSNVTEHVLFVVTYWQYGTSSSHDIVPLTASYDLFHSWIAGVENVLKLEKNYKQAAWAKQMSSHIAKSETFYLYTVASTEYMLWSLPMAFLPVLSLSFSFFFFTNTEQLWRYLQITNMSNDLSSC